MLDIYDEKAVAARTNKNALNELVRENNSFILRCASKTCRRFITESDDEYEVALVAFCEAVRAFNADAGGFMGFAALVIRRRLLDYLRTEARHAGEIAVELAVLSGDISSEEDMSPLELEIKKREVALSEEAAADGQGPGMGTVTVKDEIEAVQKLLGHYGFSFFDLADCSPKAEKTKRKCADAVAALLKDPADPVGAGSFRILKIVVFGIHHDLVRAGLKGQRQCRNPFAHRFQTGSDGAAACNGNAQIGAVIDPADDKIRFARRQFHDAVADGMGGGTVHGIRRDNLISQVQRLFLTADEARHTGEG